MIIGEPVQESEKQSNDELGSNRSMVSKTNTTYHHARAHGPLRLLDLWSNATEWPRLC